MSTANKYSPEVNVQTPNCPHCSQPLEAMCSFQWSMQLAIGVAIMLCMYCPNPECKKVIGTQILVVPGAQEPSRIASPH